MWHNIKCFSEVQMVKLSHKRKWLAFVLKKEKKKAVMSQKNIFTGSPDWIHLCEIQLVLPIFLDFCFGVASQAELPLRPTCGCPNLTLPLQS